MRKKIDVKTLVLCGLFAAMTAVCSQLAIPTGFAEPINLALFSVYLAGGLLGPVYATVSQLCYLLLGAVGLPVFAQMTGGISILVGPSGGYLIGYAAAAWLTGFLCRRLQGKWWHNTIAMVAGLFACYALGTVWFMALMGLGLWESLLMCVIPYLPGDVIKIMMAVLLLPRLRKGLRYGT